MSKVSIHRGESAPDGCQVQIGFLLQDHGETVDYDPADFYDRVQIQYCLDYLGRAIERGIDQIHVDLSLESCKIQSVDVSQADVQKFADLAKKNGYEVEIIT